MQTEKEFAWTGSKHSPVLALQLVRHTINESYGCITFASFMFLWEETVAGCGSEEIVSCWLKWLNSLQDSFDKATVFADNCAGQNKNTVMVVNAVRQVHSGRLSRWN